MLQLRTSAYSSSLTPLLRLACSTPTTILVTKLSTSTDALITSSDDLRHSTHTYDNYNNRSEQPRFPASRMWAHAYVPSASVERCRQRSCVARNAARRKDARRVRYRDEGCDIRSAYRPAERIEPGQERECERTGAKLKEKRVWELEGT